MKKLLALAVLAALVGCKTPTKQNICMTAQTAYTLYLAYQQSQINSGKPPSNDQILAAQAAAIVLQQQCGWTPPVVTKNLFVAPRVDLNGVPIIRPPQ